MDEKSFREVLYKEWLAELQLSFSHPLKRKDKELTCLLHLFTLTMLLFLVPQRLCDVHGEVLQCSNFTMLKLLSFLKTQPSGWKLKAKGNVDQVFWFSGDREESGGGKKDLTMLSVLTQIPLLGHENRVKSCSLTVCLFHPRHSFFISQAARNGF